MNPPPANGASITRIRARLTAVNVPAVPAVVRSREIWKHFVNAVWSQMRPLRALEKVHAISRAGSDVIRSADDSYRNIRYIVVWTAAIGKTSRIACESAKPLLIFRLRRCYGDVEAQ